MSENLPDNYDPTQPDLPSLAVEPQPSTEPREGVDLSLSGEGLDAGQGQGSGDDGR